MKYFIKGWAAVLLIAIAVYGCGKTDEEPEFAELSFDTQEVLDKLPSGLVNSSDSYAQQAIGAIESALDMSSFIESMTPPEDAVKTSKKASGDSWSWSVFDGTKTYTFYYTYDEDNSKKYWTMDIQFGVGERYSYITAWESKDGKQGEVVYNFNWVNAYAGEEATENYEDLFWKYNWNIDASGNYTFSWKYESSDPEYEYFMHYDVVVNSDGSGSIDYYYTDTPFYHMEWDTMGNGSWEYYADGTVFNSGTWTV